MEKKIAVSIIIPTLFTRPTLFSNLLDSLFHQKDLFDSYEIIIIDNNKQKNEDLEKVLEGWINKLPIKNFHLQVNGLHYARHYGAKVASGDLLIYIDDDIIASETWLRSYLEFFSDQNIICAGGKVLPKWEKEPDSWILDIPTDVFSLLDYGDEVRTLNSKEGINGCNFAIRKSAVFEYGGFHPDGYASEDMRWFRGDGEYGLVQKIKAQGKKVHYIPDAMLYHCIPEKRMRIESVIKITQDHAVSSAYTFIRRHNCSFLFIFLLLVGSWVYYLSSKIRNIFNMNERNITLLLKSEKYLTMCRYCLALLENKKLREYVLADNYLN